MLDLKLSRILAERRYSSKKTEYTNICQTLQTSFSTLQANIEEMRSYIRGMVTGVNNPIPYAPVVAQQYDETLQ